MSQFQYGIQHQGHEVDVLVAIELDLMHSGELAVAADLLLQNPSHLGGNASPPPGQEGGQQQASESGRKIRAVG